MEHILIIGAGATGLMATKTLSEKGYKVTVLEALDRIGGRMHTHREGTFAKSVELGAEFIHGDLPVTLGLLKDANISYHKLEGEWWQLVAGDFKKNEEGKELNFGKGEDGVSIPSL